MNGIDEDRTALIFLGTGCSGAVPEFRCLLQPSDPPCHVCSQSLSLLPHLNPNYRCNTSLLIDYCCEEEDGRHYYIIIDVGKSFREQVLRWFTFYKIPRIDSVKPLRYLLLYLLHILLLMSNDIILLCVDHSNS